MAAILNPLYENMAVFHYRGGHCQTLEEELVLEHPPHDDVMNAVADAFEISVPPSRTQRSNDNNVVTFDSRFGGVAYAS